MRVVIAGGHGQIGQRLVRSLVERGDSPVALVRSASHILDVTDLGAEVALIDLEQDDEVTVAFTLKDADAVVFTAGAGPGSGPERKDTVDRAGAVLLADAAERAGVRRYVLVSSMGVESVRDGSTPPDMDPTFLAYLQAKAAAESDVLARDLDLTIVRPGRLTDTPGIGRVSLGPDVPTDEVSRDDVAAVIAEILHVPDSAGLTVGLTRGHSRIDDAVYQVLAPDHD